MTAYLRKDTTARVGEERGERSVRNSPANTKVGEEGGRGGAPGARADSLLQPVENTTVKKTIPAVCGGPNTGDVGYFLREWWLEESPCWSRFISKDCSLWEGPHGKSVRTTE